MKSKEPAPTWQRIFCAVLTIGATAGIFSQFQNGISIELENSYLIFKLIAGLVGVVLFSCIAIRGSLPFRQKRIGHDT